MPCSSRRGGGEAQAVHHLVPGCPQAGSFLPDLSLIPPLRPPKMEGASTSPQDIWFFFFPVSCFSYLGKFCLLFNLFLATQEVLHRLLGFSCLSYSPFPTRG